MALQHLRSSTANKRPTPGSMSDGQLAMNTNLASPGLFFKDSNGALVKVGPAHVGATAPNVSPASGGQAGNSVGELWLDTSGPVLKVWDGSGWASPAVSADFGAQNITTTGSVTAGSGVIAGASGTILRVTNTGSGNSLLVEDEANPDSTPFAINATGIIISGHTASLGTVNHLGSAITPRLQQHATDQTSATIATTNWQNSSTPAQLVLSKSYGGAIGTHAPVAANATIGFVNFAASDGTTFGSAAWVGAYADALTSAGSTPGRLIFATTSPGATSPTERMRIRSDGNVGIGGSGRADATFTNAGPLTGGSTAYANYTVATIQSDATSAVGYRTAIGTAAASFATTLTHYRATQSAVGAGSTLNAQYGFMADSTLIGGGSNFGFFSDIPAGTSRWNFYAADTADNYFAGNVGIGITTPSVNLEVAKSSTGTGAGPVIRLRDTYSGAFTANTDSSALEFYSADGNGPGAMVRSKIANTSVDTTGADQALTFWTTGSAGGNTLTERARIHSSGNVSIGSTTDTGNRLYVEGSARINGQIEALADSAGAPAFTWDGDEDTGVFRANGDTLGFSTAGLERMRIRGDGNVAIGGTGSSAIVFTNQAPITGSSTSYANYTSGTVQSDVTVTAYGYRTFLGTAAAAFTVTNLDHYRASQATLGAGSSVTAQHGFRVDTTMVDGVSNYAFRATLPANAGCWNTYMDGAAPNYFAGDVRIGSTTDTGYPLYVNGSARVNGVVVVANADTDTAPGYTWFGDEDTGMFRAATNAVGISAAGAEVFQVDLGSVLASTGRRILFESNAEIDTVANALYVNSAAILYLESGSSDVRIQACYDTTTASGANVVVSTVGRMLRSTSSIKYKTDVEVADVTYSENLVYNSEPVWYRSLSDGDPQEWSYWGFIAEEVAAIDPRMVHWGDDGPESVQYDRYVVHLVNVAQKQKALIDSLEARIAALEAA